MTSQSPSSSIMLRLVVIVFMLPSFCGSYRCSTPTRRLRHSKGLGVAVGKVSDSPPRVPNRAFAFPLEPVPFSRCQPLVYNGRARNPPGGGGTWRWIRATAALLEGVRHSLD